MVRTSQTLRRSNLKRLEKQTQTHRPKTTKTSKKQAQRRTTTNLRLSIKINGRSIDFSIESRRTYL